MVELDVVESLLGVPPGFPPWRIADAANRARILPTWLSSLVARGTPLTPAAAEYLDRVRVRVDTLHSVGRELRAAHGVRVIKGEQIAARYPDGLLRNSGDTDIVAPDQGAVWRCVLDLRARYGAVAQSISLLRTDEATHIVVAMKWPAPEPFLDKPMGADVATCAFCGDLDGTVPIRAVPPPDDDLCSLFAVAEERFQRRFSRKDMLDLAVLAEVLTERFGAELSEVVLDASGRLCLAPELRRLIRKTTGWIDLPAGWLDLADRLGPIAEQEKAARKSGDRKPAQMLYGFPLDTVPSPDPELRLHRFAFGEIARTPIGNCLLLPEPELSEELYEAAMAEAERLG
ncbi:MAG: hypothetical protein HOW97_39525 [Catenulispora sp.]|nr:hypothetical protein [Catenulispora sp.]